MDIVKQILYSKNKVEIKYPYKNTEGPSYFGEGELGDILSFGYAYVEQEDHFVDYVVASPLIVKKIIREIDETILTVDSPYIGFLWTGKIFISDKVKNDHIIFSNTGFSVVLDLNLNRME